MEVSGNKLDVAGSPLPERSGGLASISSAVGVIGRRALTVVDVCLICVALDAFEAAGLVSSADRLRSLPSTESRDGAGADMGRCLGIDREGILPSLEESTNCGELTVTTDLGFDADRKNARERLGSRFDASSS